MRGWPALVALLLVSCPEDQPAIVGSPSPGPTPTVTSSPPPVPADLPGASCDQREGGSDEYVPDFVDVHVESAGGIDSVRFVFEPREDEEPSPEGPRWFAGFRDELRTDPEGAPADVEGQAFVSISFMAFGVDLSGEEPVVIYRGPAELTPGFPTVREVEELGDFEALVTWGIGLARRACFVVEASETELTVEFPSP